TDRNRVRIRTETGNLIESELGTRSEHKVVVVELSTVFELHDVSLRRHGRRGADHELDALALELSAKTRNDFVVTPPSDRNPRIVLYVSHRIIRIDELDLMMSRQCITQLERSRGSGNACSVHNDTAHLDVPFRTS